MIDGSATSDALTLRARVARGWESLAVTAVLFLGTGVVVTPSTLLHPPLDTDVSLAAQPALQTLMWLVLRGIMLWFIVRHWRRITPLLRRNIWVAGLMAMTILSAAWSSTPSFTLRQGAEVVTAGLFAYYVAVRFTGREILVMVRNAVGAALVLSVLVILALPHYAYYRDLLVGNGLRGAFVHKNPLGRCAALGAVIFTYFAATSPRRFMNAGMAIVSVVLVFRSQSSTSVVSLLAVGVVATLCIVARRCEPHLRRAIASFVGAATVAMIALGIDVVDRGLSALGRDSTLSGRTGLWDQVVPAIRARPILGYGYAAFWRGWDAPGSAHIWQIVLWHPTHAHNGFFDLFLDLGVVGAALLAGGAVTLIRQSWRHYESDRMPIALWPILYVAFIGTASFAESVLLKPTSTYWILFALAAAYAATPSASTAQGSPAVPAPSGRISRNSVDSARRTARLSHGRSATMKKR